MAASALVTKTITNLTNPANLVGNAVNVVGTATEYSGYRKEGNSVATSALKAAGSFAFGEMANMAGVAIAGSTGLAATAIGIGIMLAPAAAMASKQMFEYNGAAMAQHYNSVGYLGSGTFNMTQAGYTMRQRSLNAIRSNGLNTQSALGNEARNYYLGRTS